MSLFRRGRGFHHPSFPTAGAAAFALIAGAAGCGEEGSNPPPPNTTPAAISVVSGNNQSATVGTALPAPLIVNVTNSDGAALSGVVVSWTVVAGGGALGSATSTTNAQGQAQTTYTVGANAGANQVQAAVQSNTSLSTTFSATAAAFDNTPAAITIVGGNNQSATVGQGLPNSLVVRVTNAASQSLDGVAVSWTVTQGGGSLAAAQNQTNSQGQASNSYTVGANPGANTITAAVQSNPSLNVLFNATANAVGSSANIGVSGLTFSPSDVTIATGGTVTWSWNTGVAHDVTWDAGTPAASATNTNVTYQQTFANAGSFAYYCSIHGGPGGVGMSGTVTVQ
ncbi:MAG: plastocyanin/azurin family copper-binding protein [Gemmatimonadota bacterium]|nr:plastocyanin/azurin family copper-binding protein [Gemmatimonadota bacterium]